MVFHFLAGPDFLNLGNEKHLKGASVPVISVDLSLSISCHCSVENNKTEQNGTKLD